MSYPQVGLAEILCRAQDEVAIQPDATYRTAGIYSFGRGLFERPPITGAETKYRSYFRLHEGQFVYSKLFGWEGAVAVVDKRFDGFFVSSEFPTFDVDRDRALPQYLALLCRWSEFHVSLAGGTSGLGLRRQRVHPKRLLEVEIPLPDLDEQRRVVARLDALLSEARAIRDRLSANNSSRLVALYPGIVERTLVRLTSGTKPLGDLADFVNDLVRPGEPTDPAKAFVGLQHVESHTGRRIGELPLGGEKGRKFLFSPGDIVYGYLRPYLNKVWVADMFGLCSVDQYVLRARDGVSPWYLAHALRSRATLEEAMRLTHNLQLPRLRSGLLAEIEIPMVPKDRQAEVVASLDTALAKTLHACDLRKQQERRIVALEESVLNRAFAGSL